MCHSACPRCLRYSITYLPTSMVPTKKCKGVGEPGVNFMQGQLFVGGLHDGLKIALSKAKDLFLNFITFLM